LTSACAVHVVHAALDGMPVVFTFDEQFPTRMRVKLLFSRRLRRQRADDSDE
jgi:hypothetical protein